MVKDVTDATFEHEVLEGDLPVLVEFWAPWCGPCRAVSPILEKIAAERAETLTVVKLNVDESPLMTGSTTRRWSRPCTCSGRTAMNAPRSATSPR
jgi:thioredoxin-like negative regulator of GroEL